MSLILQALRAAFVASLLVAAAAAARAEGAICRGALRDAFIDGGLIVPDGAACTLRHVTVRGNLLAGRGSVLRIADDVAILGNVAVDRCAYVSFEPSPTAGITIGGNVDIEHCREASGKLFAAGEVDIAGSFVCHDNAAPCLAVSLTILGNALVLRNSGGLSYVEGNTIGGNLECLGNAGVSDYGQPNRVAGKKLGKCAALSEWPRIN
jgi:hypothetical protein